MSPTPIQLDAFIQSLPKTETHLHLEGSLPWELLQKLDPVRFAQTPPWWADDFRFDSFAQFERALLDNAFLWYNSPERYYEAAQLIFSRHVEQNVRYVETSFASGVIEFLGLDGPSVAAAIKAAAPKELTVRVFMGIHRNGYTDNSRAALDSCHRWEHLDGIDLHGPETLPLEAWAPSLWQRVRDAGKAVKAHTGEFCGAPQVREIVEALGVTRIEHGVRAIEDPAVIDFLLERGVALDVCPISNIKLRVSPDYASHPLPHLLQAGLVCTISTDDPMVFGNRINDEYRVAAEEMGLDRTALALLARNGFSVALMDTAEKNRHLADWESLMYGR